MRIGKTVFQNCNNLTGFSSFIKKNTSFFSASKNQYISPGGEFSWPRGYFDIMEESFSQSPPSSYHANAHFKLLKVNLKQIQTEILSLILAATHEPVSI